jgi:hypothetical protein
VEADASHDIWIGGDVVTCIAGDVEL